MTQTIAHQTPVCFVFSENTSFSTPVCLCINSAARARRTASSPLLNGADLLYLSLRRGISHSFVQWMIMRPFSHSTGSQI